MNPAKRKKLYRLELEKEKVETPVVKEEVKEEIKKVEVLEPAVVVAEPVEPVSGILKKKKTVNEPV